MPTHTAVATRAAELGLYSTKPSSLATGFPTWTDNVLLESDLALSLHFDTLETRLAFRSRLFDYTACWCARHRQSGRCHRWQIIADHGLAW